MTCRSASSLDALERGSRHSRRGSKRPRASAPLASGRRLGAPPLRVRPRLRSRRQRPSARSGGRRPARARAPAGAVRSGRPRRSRASSLAALHRAAPGADRRLDGDPLAAEQLGLRMRKVRPAVDLRQRQHEVALRDVPDQASRRRVRHLGRPPAHLHAAAEEASARDHHVVHRAGPLFAVDRDVHLRVPPARRDLERPRRSSAFRPGPSTLFTRFATAPLMPALAMLANQVVSSLPAHVRSVARPRSISRTAPSRAIPSALPACADAERADEVAAGAAVKDGQLDTRKAGDAVDDFVDRAVPADVTSRRAPPRRPWRARRGDPAT